MEKLLQRFTKYEIARIIGARALQIAMDAPLLVKISDDDLKALKYDAIALAERELQSGVLPIAISRPVPKKKKEKLQAIKEEKVSDEEIIAKEQEVEKEIVENTDEFSLVQEEEKTEEIAGTSVAEEQ